MKTETSEGPPEGCFCSDITSACKNTWGFNLCQKTVITQSRFLHQEKLWTLWLGFLRSLKRRSAVSLLSALLLLLCLIQHKEFSCLPAEGRRWRCHRGKGTRTKKGPGICGCFWWPMTEWHWKKPQQKQTTGFKEQKEFFSIVLFYYQDIWPWLQSVW